MPSNGSDWPGASERRASEATGGSPAAGRARRIPIARVLSLPGAHSGGTPLAPSTAEITREHTRTTRHDAFMMVQPPPGDHVARSQGGYADPSNWGAGAPEGATASDTVSRIHTREQDVPEPASCSAVWLPRSGGAAVRNQYRQPVSASGADAGQPLRCGRLPVCLRRVLKRGRRRHSAADGWGVPWPVRLHLWNSHATVAGDRSRLRSSTYKQTCRQSQRAQRVAWCGSGWEETRSTAL